MKTDVSKFLKVWKVLFKYLFYVSIAVTVFKVVLFGAHNEIDDLELTNILLAFAIYTLGAFFLAVVISLWAVIKDREFQKRP